MMSSAEDKTEYKPENKLENGIALLLQSGQVGFFDQVNCPEVNLYNDLADFFISQKIDVKRIHFPERENKKLPISIQERLVRKEIIAQALVEVDIHSCYIYATSLSAELLLEILSDLSNDSDFSDVSKHFSKNLHLILVGLALTEKEQDPFKIKRNPRVTSINLLYGQNDYITFLDCLSYPEYLDEHSYTEKPLEIIPPKIFGEESKRILQTIYQDRPLSMSILKNQNHNLTCSHFESEEGSVINFLSSFLEEKRTPSFNDLTFQYNGSKVHQSPSSAQKVMNWWKHGGDDWRPRKIADVGCGPGHFGLQLVNSLDSEIIFVDPSKEMLELALANAKNRGVKYQIKQAYAEKIPILDGSIDWVVSRFSSHHFIDLSLALKEFHRILKDDGILIICDLVGSEDQHLNEINHQLEILHDAKHGESYPLSKWKKKLKDSHFSLFHLIGSGVENYEWEEGLNLEEWCQITKVNPENYKKITEILEKLNPDELHELGYSKKQGTYYSHIKTLIMVAKKYACS